MAELEAITETLRRQRKDIDDLLDGTLSRHAEAAELVGKIEDLRRRTEATQRRYEATLESDSNPARK